MNVVIYWKCNRILRKRISDVLKLPQYLSVNGETDAKVDSKTYKGLREYESEGYLKLRNK